ncbi:MAG: ABC transporter permease [Alphaproteobacteria bacterium]|nr:ABC transporter permease [Alphaproteobacteria bacterium]
MLTVGPLAALALLYLYPLATVLWLSVTVPTPGVGNFAALASSAAVQRIVLTTLRVCLTTTVLALAIGYLIAYAALHVRPRHAAAMLFVVLLCFWLSVLIRAFAWLMLLQSRGVVNATLMAWGVIDAPLALVRNELGVVIGMVHYMVPYAVLPLYANMKGIDGRLVPAARGLGANRWQAFWRVYLPQSAPGLAAAGILVFIFSLGFYVTPALLGGGKTVMIAEYVSVQILDALNWGVGSMLAATLLATVVLLLATVSRVTNLGRLFGAAA